jgi:macrodomain Ter protein organizer (MatP/YcbG family)
MHLTIELPYDLETQLRVQAKQKGKALNQYITGLIQEKISSPKPATSTLTVEETRLFKTINKGFSDEFWDKLTNLNNKRQTFTLSESDRKELIDMTEHFRCFFE